MAYIDMTHSGNNMIKIVTIMVLSIFLLLTSCTFNRETSLGAKEVCELLAQIDTKKISTSEEADQTFDSFALELQEKDVQPRLKEVFNLLIGADAKDTYQLYIESGKAYQEDWSCTPMQSLLSIGLK